MNILTRHTSPRYTRDGITSYLLISERTCGSQRLSVTLVELEPGGFQNIHKHEQEQAYTILEGGGIMSVGGERQEVQVGDTIFIPPWIDHGLENTGNKVLKYLSTCSPSFTMQQCMDWWMLDPLSELES